MINTKKFFHLIKIGICSVFLIASSARSSFALTDAILAVVNDEVITLKDLHNFINATYLSLLAEGRGETELKNIIADLEKNGINKIIEEKLMISKANKIGLTIRDKLIDDKMDEIKHRYKSEEEFLSQLIDHGATISDLRKKILDQLKIKYLIEHEVKEKIFVNPQEVTNYYTAHPEQFKRNERINLESIFVAIKTEKEASQKKIQEAYDLIKTGKNFTDIAKQYSESPSVGAIEQGQLMPEIDKKVFSLKIDEITDIIETKTGYYIFKLTGRTPSENAPLKDVKDAITQFLYNQKFQNKFSDWMVQLKKKAYIEIKQ